MAVKKLTKEQKLKETILNLEATVSLNRRTYLRDLKDLEEIIIGLKRDNNLLGNDCQRVEQENHRLLKIIRWHINPQAALQRGKGGSPYPVEVSCTL